MQSDARLDISLEETARAATTAEDEHRSGLIMQSRDTLHTCLVSGGSRKISKRKISINDMRRWCYK